MSDAECTLFSLPPLSSSFVIPGRLLISDETSFVQGTVGMLSHIEPDSPGTCGDKGTWLGYKDRHELQVIETQSKIDQGEGIH